MELKHQYEGFLNMHEIGALASLPGIFPWDKISGLSTKNTSPVSSTITLCNGTFGKRMERFMSHQIESSSPWEIRAENIQIIDGQQTIGELDFIVQHTETRRLLHLELACKFYLYDPELTNEAARWVGPNRRDSLELKLQKLEKKQFPLLSHPAAQKVLKEMNIDAADMDQALSIRSMLFLPAGSTAAPNGVNPKAIHGNWYRPEDLDQFRDCLWHLPEKINWAVNPVHAQDWMDYSSFRDELIRWHAKKRAPMCWCQTPQGTHKKLFVVWW